MSHEYRAGRYRTAIEIALASGNIAATARAADIPRTTLRGAIARQTNFGNPIVRTPGVSAGAGSVITTEIEEILQDLVDERPELTLLELVGEIEARCNILVDRTTVLRHLQALHITNKRLVLVPAERNTPEACQKRVVWALTWTRLDSLGVRFMYLDEAWFSLHTNQNRGWALVSRTPEIVRPGNRGVNVSLLACMVPSFPLDMFAIKRGSIVGDDLLAFLHQVIVPNRERNFPNDAVVIVLDNASCHRADFLRAVVDSGMRYLPTIPYSPQTNSIERVFAQVKGHVRRYNRGGMDQLVHEIEAGCRSVTPQDTFNFDIAHRIAIEEVLLGRPLESDRYHRVQIQDGSSQQQKFEHWLLRQGWLGTQHQWLQPQLHKTSSSPCQSTVILTEGMHDRIRGKICLRMQQGGSVLG